MYVDIDILIDNIEENAWAMHYNSDLKKKNGKYVNIDILCGLHQTDNLLDNKKNIKNKMNCIHYSIKFIATHTLY